MNTSSTHRFLRGAHAIKHACAYLRDRSVDAQALRKLLVFTFNDANQLQADLYGHSIRMNGDGGGYVLSSDGHASAIRDLAQAVAYILAVNW